MHNNQLEVYFRLSMGYTVPAGVLTFTYSTSSYDWPKFF